MNPEKMSRRRLLTGALAGITAARSASLLADEAEPSQPRRILDGPRPKFESPITIDGGTTDPADFGLLEGASMLRRGKLSARERLASAAERIRRLDPQVHAFARCYPELAANLADAAQRKLSGKPGDSPLCAQPVALKDWFKVAGLPLEAGSPVWKGYVADVDCTAWERLREHGMVLVGHTHAFEPVTAPPTRNPWNLEKNPGGSSAGSAVAVATGMVPVALGSETTQSLRQPASHCGISTIKPSYGQLSLYGVLRFIHSYDHPGVLGRSVQDCSIALQAMLGMDLRDETTLGRASLSRLPIEPTRRDRPYAGLRLGIPDGLGKPDAGVAAVWNRALREVETLGAELVPVKAAMFADDYSAPLDAEILHEHRRLGFFPGRVCEYGPGFRNFILQLEARQITLDAYITARREREASLVRWMQMFQLEKLAAIFLPSCEFEVGTFGLGHLDARFVRWSNLCGLPAVGFPGGLSRETSMPVGLQFVGALDRDREVIALALEYQAHFDYHRARPQLLEVHKS